MLQSLREAYAELWLFLRRRPSKSPQWRTFWKWWIPLFVVVMVVGELVGSFASYAVCAAVMIVGFTVGWVRQRQRR